MFTTKKNNAMKTGGITASRSRGTARSARPAMVDDVVDEARRVAAGSVARATCGVDGGHRTASSRRARGRRPWRSSSLVVLDAVAGELEEHVVERRRAQREVADRDAGVCRARPRPGRSSAAPSSAADDELVAARASTASTPSSRRERARRAASASPSTRATITSCADAALELGRACPRRRAGRRR